MRAALYRVDVVAVGLLHRGVAVGVLHRHLGLNDVVAAVEPLGVLLPLEVDDRRNGLLVRVEVLRELVDSAFVVEGLVVVLRAFVVAEVDRNAPVEERELAYALHERLPPEGAAREDRVVGEERDRGARVLRSALADDLEGLRDVSARELDVVHFPAALHVHLHPLGERVHAGYAHAVETAGHLVVRPVELAAGVEHREHDLDRGAVLRGVHVDRDAAAVVLYGERSVRIDHDVDHRAVAGQGFVDRVVDHFVDEVVVAPLARVAYVHGRALAHGLHAFEDRDVGGVVLAAGGFFFSRCVRFVFCHG